MTSSPVTDTQSFQVIKFAKNGSHQLVRWRVREGDQLEMGTVLFEYQTGNKQKISKFASFNVGVLHKILIQEGGALTSNSVVCEFEKNCDHPEVVCGMCTHCGEAATAQEASVPIVIGIPQIRVSKQQAEDLAKDDKLRLLRQKKLALIVDLDQTLVHTSTDVNIRAGLPDVYGFRLNNYPHRYHARLRPHVHELLDKLSPLYELYIFTMGTHCYAHTLSKILDPQRKLFSQRIISRDECFDSRSKLPTIRSVFPCGDEMVAIIDDREDMWARCPNLVHVKPYIFFGSTGDIHAPEKMSHQDPHEGTGGMPSHFTPPVITPPPAPAPPNPTPSESRVDVDPPTESDSGDGPTDNNFASITFQTDPVAPVTEPSPPIQEDPVAPVASVTEQNIPEAVDEAPTPPDTCENNEYSEQLIPPLSSSSDSSDTSEDSNSGSNSSSSQLPEGKVETKSGPDIQAEPPPLPPPPQAAPPENETRKDVTEINDPDKFLLYLITTLTKIHSMFYDKYARLQTEYDLAPTREQRLITPDLKEIIPRLRHSVLKGACLVFTGVIPTNRNPQDDPLWNTARAFGAVIHDRIHTRQEGEGRQSSTTHVIATKPGTNKYREAIRVPGIRIVTPDWLWACAETWQWIDEKDFAVRVRRESKDKLGQLLKKPHLSVEGAEEERDTDYPPFLESEFPNAPTSSQQMDTIEPLTTHLDIDLSKVSEEKERVFTPERISFSLEDINAMNEEVNLACDCTSSSGSSNELQDYPEGVSRKRKRPVKSEPTTDDTTGTGSSTDREDASGSFDTMAALLEREFEADKV